MGILLLCPRKLLLTLSYSVLEAPRSRGTAIRLQLIMHDALQCVEDGELAQQYIE